MYKPHVKEKLKILVDLTKSSKHNMEVNCVTHEHKTTKPCLKIFTSLLKNKSLSNNYN